MLDQILGDIPTPLKFVIAFAVIILLMVVAVWLGRRFGGQRFGPTAATGRSRQPRLGVLDVLAVDGRRRLVIVRRDNVEHLIMIGGPNDVVVESGILRVPTGMTAQRDAPAILPPDPAPSRTAPPQPVPPSPGPRVAPTAPVPAAQPAAERAQPERQQPKTVEAPPIVPAQRVAAPQPAQQRPPAPPVRPATPQAEAPAARPQPAPARPAPPVEASKPAEPAGEDKPAPQTPAAQPAPPIAPRPVPQQIIAGPAGRGVAQRGPAPTTRSSDLAERLAAALKRPVQPAPERAQAQGAPAAPAAPVASAILAAVAAPAAPAASEPAASAEPKAAPAPQAGPNKPDEDLPREMPPMADQAAPEAKPDQKPAAPEVKAEPRAEKPEAPEDDPLASLEAEMANLLGRDVAKRP
ncbi:flagellar biosynthetic protein FliO [Hansschlegelia zhihuaiae]|uniref:Flagellar biosynthesis protein FliO n=1 Tax=Hansschlegelia zhihuaiae TaxID=405005 RepID=A0A4Q0MH70_9HYPH|nr:flagellar biosynthetic protein FliO [Hansschlegelia zhihuaiae]RXF72633.1 hypothetical protein EK403_13770 [Hansschlegelia zhihuaiae]